MKKLNCMVKSDEKYCQVSNPIDRYNEEAMINSLPNPFVILSDSIFKPFVASLFTNFITKLEDKNIKQLTEMIQSLVLSIYTI